MRVVKVQAITKRFDVCGLTVRIVLQNELLEPNEGAFMRHLLAKLDNGFPGQLRVHPGAVWTVLVAHHKLGDEDLLQDCVCEHLIWL